MPLHKTIQFNKSIQVLVWKITETFEQLYNEVELSPKNLLRLNEMKSNVHQRGFLSVRKLLQEVGYTDFDLFYDEFGKPYLEDVFRHTRGKTHISITHSHEFSAIILSDENCGIDIELQREKIIKIADKFVESEFEYLKEEHQFDYIGKLTTIWGAKEAIFKIQNEKGISFKNNIKVLPFSLNEKKATAYLNFESIVKCFSIHFEEIENFILVYAFEK